VRRLAVLAAGILAGLLVVLTAQAAPTAAFYSHGWGVGTDTFIYFPHAFVVLHGPAPQAPDEAYGFTAVSQGLVALVRPTRGMVDRPQPVYRGEAKLHFSVTLTDDESVALYKVIDAWGARDAPLYDLDKHNCVGFVAALAQAADLKTPEVIGRDPEKFLEAVKRLNPERVAALPHPTPPDPPSPGLPPPGNSP
jgi:hypothetical protein